MPNKETKDFQIKVRVSAIEKNNIDCYCQKHNMTISSFLREAIDKLLKEDKEDAIF